MNCPRCQVELEEGHCPKCNWSISTPSSDQNSEEDGSTKSPHVVAQNPIEFNVEFAPATTLSRSGDWRAELRKKLDEHYRQKDDDTVKEPVKRRRKKRPSKTPVAKADVGAEVRVAANPPESQAKTDSPGNAEEKKGEVVRQLFRYKLPEVRKETEKRIVTFRREPDQPATRPLEKPLIRPPVKARPAPRPSGPQQRTLSLGKLALSDPHPPDTEKSDVVGPPQRISREVLFSRVLAFVIDIVIALTGGFLFSFVAAQALGMSFPSPSLVRLATICAVGFFYLNSIFFLAIAGQTPGMSWTELKIANDRGGEVHFGSVVFRTALLLPVAATLIGVFWAVFDPFCRCWHDLLSGTRIVPEYLLRK